MTLANKPEPGSSGDLVSSSLRDEFMHKKYGNNNPTPAQLAYIAAIEQGAPYEFDGTTKEEASAYISEYKKYLRSER